MMENAGSLREVFTAFLKLGLTSFGGPVAHIGYFRDEFVLRRKWLGDAAFAEYIALCQFLPGPASSQLGFVLGMVRGGGLAGGLAAWVGFTLPSALLMLAFAYGAASLAGPVGAGLLHGLKLVAVSIVAQAVFGMARTLTPDLTRAAIAIAACAAALLLDNAAMQMVLIAAGGLLGMLLCRGDALKQVSVPGFGFSRRHGLVALALFGLLLVVPAALRPGPDSLLFMFDAFYRSGALVFGGGHVVLPLLQSAFVDTGLVNGEAFIAGYGAAQAVPGPLFTFAAYLGAVAGQPPAGVAGSMVGLVAIFLPGLLLVYGTLPFWRGVRGSPLAQAGMKGANAAVVGLLAAAFYNPVWTTAVLGPLDIVLAAAGFLALVVLKAPSWSIVVALALAGVAFY